MFVSEIFYELLQSFSFIFHRFLTARATTIHYSSPHTLYLVIISAN